MAFTQNSCDLGNTTPTCNACDLRNVFTDADTMILEDFTEAFRRWCIEKNIDGDTPIFKSEEVPRSGVDFKENNEGKLGLIEMDNSEYMCVGEFIYHLDKMCAEGFADVKLQNNYEIKKINSLILIGYDMNHDSYVSSKEYCFVVIS